MKSAYGNASANFSKRDMPHSFVVGHFSTCTATFTVAIVMPTWPLIVASTFAGAASGAAVSSIVASFLSAAAVTGAAVTFSGRPSTVTAAGPVRFLRSIVILTVPLPPGFSVTAAGSGFNVSTAGG